MSDMQDTKMQYNLTADERAKLMAESERQRAVAQQYQKIHETWAQKRTEAEVRHRARELSLQCASTALSGAVDVGLVMSAASKMEAWLLETGAAFLAHNQPPPYPDDVQSQSPGVLLNNPVFDAIKRSKDQPWG